MSAQRAFGMCVRARMFITQNHGIRKSSIYDLMLAILLQHSFLARYFIIKLSPLSTVTPVLLNIPATARFRTDSWHRTRSVSAEYRRRPMIAEILCENSLIVTGGHTYTSDCILTVLAAVVSDRLAAVGNAHMIVPT